MTKSLVEMCTDIVSAQASHSQMSSEDIVESLRRVFRTLQEVQHLGGTAEPEEGMSRDPGTSIQRNQVLCLECGKAFKLLSNRHLALHDLTPRAYKQKHGIRMTQALSARTLSSAFTNALRTRSSNTPMFFFSSSNISSRLPS